MGCPKCGEENPERAKFCLNCGASLTEQSRPRHEVRKTVTIVFVDVTGSTNLGEQLDPESLRRVMEGYFDQMRSAIENHGGTVEKFIGDAVMAVFGLPLVHEDDALRATRAAAEMRERLAELNRSLRSERGVELQIRIGVNTGQVVAGDPTAGQALVTGDAVNVAARLEQAAQPGQILVGEETYRLVHVSVEVDEVQLLSVKGKELPVAAYPLQTVERRGSGRRRNMRSPLLGRDRERDLLLRAFDRSVEESRSHMFTILGSAGVGKSRLVDEVLAEIGERAQIYSGRCLSYGEGNTFWPIQEIVKSAAGLFDDEPVGRARRKVFDLLGGDDADSIASIVEQAIGLTEADASVEEIYYAIRKLFERLAKSRPLVVLFDDIHWGEPAFLDLIEHVADWSRDASILLVCVARPDLLDTRPMWGGGKMNASSILLEPLAVDETDQLVGHLLGGAGLDGSIHDRIISSAGGNPLFIEEMVEMMVDEGYLGEDDGTWKQARDVADLVVPPTIQALLAARIDLLGSEERAALEAASVVGQVFYRGALDELVGERLKLNLSKHLMSLVRKELIREDVSQLAGDQTFKFRHILVQETAYESIPKEQRAQMHERFARWLIATAGERLVEFEEIVGHHLEQAFRLHSELGPIDESVRRIGDEAVDILLNAADRAKVRDDVSAATVAYGRVASLMHEDDARLPGALRRLSVAQRSAGRLGEAVDTIKRASETARRLGDEVEVGYCALEAVDVLTSDSDPDWTQRAETEALHWRDFFERRGDDTGLALTYHTLATVSLLRSRWKEVLPWATLANVHAARGADRGVDDASEHTLLAAYLFGPTPADEALDKMLEMEANPDATLTFRARSRWTRAPLHAMRREFDTARQLIAEARTYFADRGHGVYLAALGFGAGPVEQYAGNIEGAIRALEDSDQRLAALGERGYRGTIDGMIALLQCRAGRFDEAERFALQARDLSPTSEDAMTEMTWRGALARVMAERGRLEEAVALGREALEIADTTDFCNEKADLLLVQADVHQMVGDHERVVVLTKSAQELYEVKGNLAALDQIQPRLRALAERA